MVSGHSEITHLARRVSTRLHGRGTVRLLAERASQLKKKRPPLDDAIRVKNVTTRKLARTSTLGDFAQADDAT